MTSHRHEPKTFIVEGLSATQGSLTPFPYMKGDGHLGVAVPQDKKVLKWRKTVAMVAKEVFPSIEYKQYEPVTIELVFCFERPKSSKREHFTVKKADLDKLQRTILDALSGIVYEDDCQVIRIHACKVYADKNCVFVRVTDIDTPYSDLYQQIRRGDLHVEGFDIKFIGGQS